MRNAILLLLSAGVVWAQERPTEYQLFQADVEKAAQARVQDLKVQMAKWQATIDQLKKRYSDAYPDVKTAKQQMLQVGDQLVAAQRILDEARLKKELQPTMPKTGDAKIPLPDLWWRNAATVQYLALSADQQKKMDDVVTQYRMELVLRAMKLNVAEMVLDSLVSAEPLDETKTSDQIDAVALSRAELEKTNGHMLLGIRKLLTPEQWTKLNQSFTLNLTKESTR